MQVNMEERQALMKASKKSKTKKVKEETVETTDPKPGSSKSCTLKRSTDATTTLMDPEIKKIKMNYSVAKDPKVTDVYKSLFTSHDSEKKQDRAHWITYNPFYN